MPVIRDIYSKYNRPIGRMATNRLFAALVVFVVSATLFVYIAREVTQGETLRTDSNILLWINSIATPLLDSVMTTLTQLGDVPAVALATVVLLTVFARKKKWQAAAQVAFGMAGAVLLNVTLKLLFERHRPHLWDLLVHESSYSFPSGHAMLTATLAFTCVILAWNTRWRWLTIALGALYMLVIGFTRLYLGVHYPTDVMAGWVAAFAWVLIVATVIGAVRRPR